MSTARIKVLAAGPKLLSGQYAWLQTRWGYYSPDPNAAGTPRPWTPKKIRLKGELYYYVAKED